MSHVRRFRKKPVEIAAIQYTGYNWKDVAFFCGDWKGTDCPIAVRGANTDDMLIRTLEGVMNCPVGHWVIKGLAGEFYPCRPDIFEQSYEEVLP